MLYHFIYKYIIPLYIVDFTMMIEGYIIHIVYTDRLEFVFFQIRGPTVHKQATSRINKQTIMDRLNLPCLVWAKYCLKEVSSGLDHDTAVLVKCLTISIIILIKFTFIFTKYDTCAECIFRRRPQRSWSLLVCSNQCISLVARYTLRLHYERRHILGEHYSNHISHLLKHKTVLFLHADTKTWYTSNLIRDRFVNSVSFCFKLIQRLTQPW